MMIVHQRRHHDVRQADRSRSSHPVEAIVLDLRFQRAIGIIAPVGNKFVERYGIDHGTGENVGADFRSLFDHDDRQIGIDLLETDRCTQARGAGADDHNVELHRFTRRKWFGAHADVSKCRLGTVLNIVLPDFDRKNNPVLHATSLWIRRQITMQLAAICHRV